METLRVVLGYFGLPALFFAAFFLTYKINRASLIPSVFFTGFLFVSAVFAALGMYYSDSPLARIVIVILLLAFLFVALFGVYALIAFLLLNARAVLKREKRSLANALTLILALAIIGYLIFIAIVDHAKLPMPFRVAATWIQLLVLFYAVHVTQFMTAAVLCNLTRPRKNQDFVIVHGAWLKDGKVTPLLAGRVDKAVKFYDEQKKTAVPPKLILSGGKGSDETRSEAEAMAEYAMGKGVPAEDILLEAKSVSTLENMRFSKEIMESAPTGKPYRAIYATSDYHVLRTGIYARKAGLKINGIGSRTAFYYLPVAFLREYAAYIVMHRKRNVAYVALGLAFSCGLALLSAWSAQFAPP